MYRKVGAEACRGSEQWKGKSWLDCRRPLVQAQDLGLDSVGSTKSA